jgi:P-type Cu+ transporter
MAALTPLVDEGRLTIVKPLASHMDPILELSYTPSPPSFTVRTLIHAISLAGIPGESAGAATFTARIHHPPTVEERSRRMLRREQRSLLRRLAFSVVVAIPTFIIGVVYMSLVPKHDHTRAWFMAPLWTGNASRLEWALFFLVRRALP